ncbi:MAG: lamin tail domain-containing protein [Flavobacteriales bacterium]
MKQALLPLFLLFTANIFAQNTCNELFISEYVEGWSNNKALEIYNPTNNAIDLSGYFVSRYSNGATTATVANSIQLTGTIPAKGVYVGVLQKLDPNGTGQEAPVWDSLQARADGFYCPDYNVSNAWYWNGNDALLLAKGTLPASATAVINATNVTGFAIVDVFGKIGENPANETGTSAGNDGAWSSQFPYSTGLGVLLTKDHSLIRKATILKGQTSNPSFFDPLLEWDSIPPVIVRLDANGDTLYGTSGNPILDGNWSSLGTHECNCNNIGLQTETKLTPSIYPNPSTGLVYVKTQNDIRKIQVVSALGQQIKEFNVAATQQLVEIDLDNLHGVYFLRLTNQAGEQSLHKVILR